MGTVALVRMSFPAEASEGGSIKSDFRIKCAMFVNVTVKATIHPKHKLYCWGFYKELLRKDICNFHTVAQRA